MAVSTRRKCQSIGRRYILLGIALLCGLGIAMVSCQTMDTVTKVGTTIGTATGVLTQSQAESIQKSATAVAKTFKDITPEQEYYVGRTIGAVVLDKFKPYQNLAATQYINRLGQTLARASDRPETFGGYHFLILDSDDINAFAAPGGFIFVTRGLLRCCLYESAVASVLAHEIGHVQLMHGLQAIKKSRITSALTILGIEGAKTFGGEQLASLTKTFENSIADISNKLINSGYSRSFEIQADKAAVTILKRVGYDPNALVDMLKVMQQRLKPGGIDFAKTHPTPADRISAIEKTIGGYAPVNQPKARQSRFNKYLRKI